MFIHHPVKNLDINRKPLMPEKPKKLLDLVHDTMRRKHYAIRTEQAYISWIRRFVLYHDKRHPKDMGTPEIEAYLTHRFESSSDLDHQTVD